MSDDASRQEFLACVMARLFAGARSVGVGANSPIILTDTEVQKVIQALRAGNIRIVELHNHGLAEQPRLFYMHYWAVDDAVKLAKGLRPALDSTNLQPA